MKNSKGAFGCLLLATFAHAACGDDGSGGAGGEGTTTSTATSGSSKTTSAGNSSANGSTTGTSSASGGTTTSSSTTASATSATQSSSSTGMALPPQEDWTRDVTSYALSLDLTTLKGTATIVLADAASTGASFEIGDLTITSVTDGTNPLLFEAVPGTGTNPQQLNVGVPDVAGPTTLVIAYDFAAHPGSGFDGWMPDPGLSFLWPYFCGNLFPCKSDTTDGATFTLAVSGVPAGEVAVFPASIPGDAPTYMPALAIGQYTKVVLGTTTAGTTVNVWHLPGEGAAAAAGTANLVDVFDFYESTYGAYSFGTEVGTVSADWGPSAYGGMEHHPYWHVANNALDNEEVNAHEAAHGWFGNGVRIDCWEDFVLSEGTATYLAARALGESNVDLWPSYECELKRTCEGTSNTIAYPATCDTIDIFNDPIWSGVPYMKGAFFWQAVAAILGEDVLDEAFAEFYVLNVGKAANMQDLIDHAKTKGDAAQALQIDAAAQGWLHTLACPIDTTPLCPVP